MASSRNPGGTPRRAGREDPVVVPMRGRTHDGGPDGIPRGAPRGGIARARRYQPRGRTVRETSGRDGPTRSELRVLDGGRADQPTSEPRRAAAGAAASRGGGRTTAATRSKAATSKAATSKAASKPKPKPARRNASAGRSASAGQGRVTPRAKRRVPGRPAQRRRRPAFPRLGNPMRRLRFGTVVLLLMFVVISGRLVELQLTDAKAYAAEALRQRLSTVVLHAPRGAILDANGAVLAHSVEARYVAVDPHMIENVAEAAAKLSPLLGIPASELRDKMKRRDRADGTPNRFVYLARGVDIKVGDQVKALNVMGVRVDYDERREAPGHDLAANVIGFISRDGRGLAGMEARHDELLRGVDGEDSYEIGGNRRQIPDGYRRHVAARPGNSLQLTLDRDLQFEAQQALADRMTAAGATFGAAVVLDIRTGAVLALASYPTYSASDPFQATTKERTDYTTSAVVEPGSVHKAIVMGAALEEGIVRPDSTLVVPPTIRKGGVTYRDTHPHATVRMTLPGIMAHSSNVGTILLADHLGAQRVYDYQRRFGLGQRTGVGLPGEAAGIVQPPDRWSGSSYGSIPIGLGVAATPLQMAAAYATIANDGVLVQPRLVRGTVDHEGGFTAAPAPPQRRVMSADNARALQQMMEAVVTADNSTGKKAAIPGYRVAGKTGTGMRVVDNSYLPGNVASFVGMAPAENPRYVVAVFAQAGKQAGGTLAAPVFSDIMSFTLRKHRVPPSSTKPPEFRIYA